VVDVSDRVGVWTEIRSVNSTNIEEDGHVAQLRIGLAFGSGVGRRRAK
jgi:hypothetical protein